MNNPKRSFEFKNVLLLKLYLFPLIGALLIAPVILGITFLINNSLPVLIGACSVGFAVMFALFNCLSKNVTISFDRDHITFEYSGNAISYPKTELIGFYSFNYFKQATSTVSMCFKFTDGKKIDLSDYLAMGKYIKERNRMLEDFLTTAQEELGFTAISVNKMRKLGKIGSTWYSRGNPG